MEVFLSLCPGIENSMIAFIAEFAKKQGAKTLVGEYLPTAKNKPAADMYEKFQFKKANDTLFKADLEQQKFAYPSYLKLTIKAPNNRGKI